MAHTALHFAIGLAVGSAVAAPSVLRALAGRPQTASLLPLTRMVLLAWTLGLWAVVPNILRALGMPESFCGGWWMNVFLLHPTLDRLVAGGTLIGGILLAAVLAGQYGLIVLAIALARHRAVSAPSATP